jgi:hypothetical protein
VLKTMYLQSMEEMIRIVSQERDFDTQKVVSTLLIYNLIRTKLEMIKYLADLPRHCGSLVFGVFMI